MTRETLKEWLKEHHRDDRQWLADQCGKSLNTVYTWFSTRPIPRDAQVIIQRLMDADEEKARVHATIPQNLVLEFSRDDFNAICDRAMKENKRPNQWAEDTLREIAQEDMDELEKHLKVAEDGSEYNKPPKREGEDVE